MASRPAPSPTSAPASAGWGDGWSGAAVCGAILLLCFLIYAPALRGGFLWDDTGHVTRPELRSLSGLARIWFEVGATQQYYPVLHSAFWFEHRLWGDSPVGYHVLNVLLHATAACLFGAVLRRLGVRGAWLAAMLFAVHPVCVESVAWISEQKNTLSTVLYLAAAWVYVRFDRERRPRDYVVATAFFVMALLTKTVTATLPAALWVVFWWQRGRLDLRRDLLPLLPWLAAGALAGLHTAQFERELIGAQGDAFALTIADRFVLAGRVAWFYLGKLLWPAELVFIYPRWTVDAAEAWQWAFLAAAVALLIALAVWSRRPRGPLAAVLFFGGSLFPVLGFFNVFPFVYSYVADHFQYLASLGIFALAGALGSRAVNAVSPRVAWIGPAAIVGALAVLTWRQAGMYRDVFTLYERTVAANPACWMAHNNLAIALADAGRVEEAIPHLKTALEQKPDFAPAANNLGDDLLRLNRPQEAIPYLERAIQLQPRYAVAHRNLGLALAAVNRIPEAMTHFERAVQLDPADAVAEANWAVGLMLTRGLDAAVPHFERAVQLNPRSVQFQVTYGRALARDRHWEPAIARFRAALELEPDSAEAHYHLAQALRNVGRREEATSHHRRAVELNPRLAPAN